MERGLYINRVILHPRMKNPTVVADTGHSHYDGSDGHARHLRDALPHATLIASTGTPISFEDRNTRDVFGEYIDIYDLTRAVENVATVGLDITEHSHIEATVAVVNAVCSVPRTHLLHWPPTWRNAGKAADP